MTPFAEIDPSATWVGISVVIAALSAALGGWAKSRREAVQGEQIATLKAWQDIHEQDRAEILALKAEMLDTRRRLDTSEAKFSRMMGHIVYLERMLQGAGIKVETWQEAEARLAAKPPQQ